MELPPGPMIRDTLNRPLGSLRVSVTDRCNLRCRYCMPEAEYVWLPKSSILTFEEIARLVRIFTGLGVAKVRLTGREPLLQAGGGVRLAAQVVDSDVRGNRPVGADLHGPRRRQGSSDRRRAAAAPRPADARPDAGGEPRHSGPRAHNQRAAPRTTGRGAEARRTPPRDREPRHPPAGADAGAGAN